MGQCTSIIKGQDNSIGNVSHVRSNKKRGVPLSATFHVYDNDLQWDLLNINSASEEELMTLPGISRSIAHNIMEYRQTIGGFRKVEDLALVSGVGARKLEQVRSEICVSSYRTGIKGGSQSSSGNISLESFTICENNLNFQGSQMKTIDVNRANVFQLMSVQGISQELAANIIYYREKKGPFRTLDDLLKVKGIKHQKFAMIRFFLTLGSSTSNGENVSLPTGTPQNDRSIIRNKSSYRKTLSAPSLYNIDRIRLFDEASKAIYDFLSDHCHRPIVEEVFNYSRNDKPAIRIAVWNMEGLTIQKVRNPGVQEVICRTILENGISLIALQDVTSDLPLSLLATELSYPQQKKVSSWMGERGKWKSALPTSPTREGSCGFLFDTIRNIELQDAKLFMPANGDGIFDLLTMCVGHFKVDGMSLTVVNHHLKVDTVNGEVGTMLKEIMKSLPEQLGGEKRVVLVGDFCLPPTDPALEALTSNGFSHLVPARTVTNLNTKKQDTHFWASDEVERIFTGHWGIVHDGLSHPAIPAGWMLNGHVSLHCPLWVEIYVQKCVRDNYEQPPNGQLRVLSTDNQEKATQQLAMKDIRKKKNSPGRSKSFRDYFQRSKRQNNKDLFSRSKSIDVRL